MLQPMAVFNCEIEFNQLVYLSAEISTAHDSLSFLFLIIEQILFYLCSKTLIQLICLTIGGVLEDDKVSIVQSLLTT